MTQKHTPGPWEWRLEKPGDQESAYHHESLLGPDNIPVLTANDGLGLVSEYVMWHNKADKPLIAAATDLLAALESFVSRARGLKSKLRRPLWLEASLTEAEAAIAKAQGR